MICAKIIKAWDVEWEKGYGVGVAYYLLPSWMGRKDLHSLVVKI